MRTPMRTLIVLGAALATALPAATQGDAPPSETYDAMRARVLELYQQQDYAGAREVLRGALERYPDHLRANAYNLALVCAPLGRLEEGIAALERAVDAGHWFGVHGFAHELWDPYRKLEAFQRVLSRSEARMAAAQASARPERFVVTPAGYDPQRRYPLFIALHGGMSNVARFRPYWTSPRMERDFIVAYLQSSQLVAPEAYSWTEEMSLTLAELRAAFDTLRTEYAVEPGRTIVGGFSSGGVAALEVALADVIPVAGFISLCPARPEDLTADRVASAKARGVRGVLITTEMDDRLEGQRQMAAVFEAAGLPHRFEVTPDIGHWFPDDLAARIDRAIAFIHESD